VDLGHFIVDIFLTWEEEENNSTKFCCIYDGANNFIGRAFCNTFAIYEVDLNSPMVIKVQAVDKFFMMETNLSKLPQIEVKNVV